MDEIDKMLAIYLKCFSTAGANHGIKHKMSLCNLLLKMIPDFPTQNLKKKKTQTNIQ